MDEQYQTLDKFDKAVTALMGGNNLHSKPATLQELEFASVQTFTVQTIRTEKGDYVSIQIMDKDGAQRFVLPPRVVSTIVRQKDSLTTQARRNSSRAVMKERMAAGWVPTFAKKEKL